MMPMMTVMHWLQDYATIVGAFFTTALIAGFILKPWIEDKIVKPSLVAAHQVSVNNHASETPTVLDQLEDIHKEVKELRNDMQQHREDYLVFKGAHDARMHSAEVRLSKGRL